MKKSVKSLIIIGIILAIIGCAILIFGLINSDKNYKMITNDYDISEHFTSFAMDYKTANVEIQPSQNDSVKVTCQEREKVRYNVFVTDGALTIKVEEDLKWYEKIFNFGIIKDKITVSVPSGDYENLIVTGTTGNVKTAKEIKFNNVEIRLTTGVVELNSDVKENIKIETTTGNINLNGLTCKRASLSATTGNIILNSLTVSDELSISATTGNVRLSKINYGSVAIVVTTGNVNLSETFSEGNTQINATTGNVRFDKADSKEIRVVTTTGNVTGTFQSGKTFYCESNTGIKILPNSVGGKCEIKTTTGDIIIEIAK